MSLLSESGICLRFNIRTWTRSSSRAIICLSASLHRSNDCIRYRNFNLLSIAYASPPRLRSRLTLRRRSLLRNPYAFGGKDSHLSFRYSYQHSHFPQVHRTFQFDFYPMGTLPYPVYFTYTATASVSYFSPGNLRRRVSRPVSYYALFKWWLLLSQHPGCL